MDFQASITEPDFTAINEDMTRARRALSLPQGNGEIAVECYVMNAIADALKTFEPGDARGWATQARARLFQVESVTPIDPGFLRLDALLAEFAAAA